MYPALPDQKGRYRPGSIAINLYDGGNGYDNGLDLMQLCLQDKVCDMNRDPRKALL